MLVNIWQIEHRKPFTILNQNSHTAITFHQKHGLIYMKVSFNIFSHIQHEFRQFRQTTL